MGVLTAFCETRGIKSHLRDTFFIQPIVREFKGYVLDVGCGVGSYLKAYEGPSLGIDANINNVNRCLEQNINAIQADANLFIRENTFDTVLLSHVLEHLIKPSNIIENIYRSVKPGGRIIILVPCLVGFISGYNDLVGHRQFITEDYLDYYLIKNLKTTKLKSYEFPPIPIPKLSKYQELRLIYIK